MKTLIRCSRSPTLADLCLALGFAFFLATSALAQTYTLNQTTTAAAVGATDTTVALTSASAATGSTFGAVAAGRACSSIRNTC
jgi:hypothetical protein